MAEPFWYVDSPLTTPSADHPFTGRPPKGEDPVAAPGVIAPDVEVTLAGGDRVRIRALARRFGATDTVDASAGDVVARVMELAADLDAEAVAEAMAGLRCQTFVLPLAEVDPDGSVAQALGAHPGEAWVFRPDAHIAAVATSATDAASAAYRAVGATAPANV